MYMQPVFHRGSKTWAERRRSVFFLSQSLRQHFSRGELIPKNNVGRKCQQSHVSDKGIMLPWGFEKLRSREDCMVPWMREQDYLSPIE